MSVIRTAAAGLLFAAAVVGAQPTLRIVPLIVEGDVINGIGTVSNVTDVVVNSRGEWIVAIDTDNADVNVDELLIRNGHILLREREPIPGPVGGEVVWSFNAPTLNDAGESIFWFSTLLGSTVGSGMYFSGGPNIERVLLPGDSADLGGTDPATAYRSFADGKINSSRRVFARVTLDEPSIPGFAEAAMVRYELGGSGAVLSATLLALQGALAPGLSGVETFEAFQVTPTQNAMDNSGNVIFQARVSGDTSMDNIYYLNSTIIARQGAPAPVPGRVWAELNTTSAADMNDAGSWVLRAPLAGDAATDQVIVKDGVKFLQEGDPVPAFGGALAQGFGSGTAPVRIDDLGNVVYFLDTDLADTTTDTALMRGERILVRERITPVAGATVQSWGTGPGWFNVSDNGRYVIFIANLPNRPGAVGFATGAFLVDTCPADHNRSGDITVQDIYDFLTDWSAGLTAADFNTVGGVTVQDIYDFFTAWSAGCW